jgi:hypothetical protein
MASTILGSQAITLPADTTANRPTASTGMTRVNTSTGSLEFYNGSAWVSTAFPGSSASNPASSAVQIFNAGIRGKGFFWLTSSNGGVVQNYCDLDTLDEDGVAGWILVAQFPYSSGWRNPGKTTRNSLNPLDVSNNESAQNDLYTRLWSANWGDYTMNKFRVHNTENVQLGGTNARADWYYHYTTACKWKEVWNYKSGTGNWFSGTAGDNAGNINAANHSGWPTTILVDPQPSIRGFNWSYNMKLTYKLTTHRWNGLTDNSGDTSANGTYSFWEGLTTPNYTLGYDLYGDGSLGMLKQGATQNQSGQDQNEHSAKFGIDDDSENALWATTATQDNGQNGVTDLRRQLYFWIK